MPVELVACPERKCVDCGKPSGTRRARCETCDQLAPRTPASSVAWDQELTLLRQALPAGAGVGIGSRGVVVDLIGERKTFPDLTAALDHYTAPPGAL